MKRATAPERSLSGAQRRINGLLDELNETVELAARLTRLGEHQTAVRLVDEQRDALYAAVDEISRDVARSNRWWETAQRHTTALVAGFALILSSVAVAVGISRTPEPTLIERANAHIAEAHETAEPLTRIEIIEQVVMITRSMPAGSAETVAIADQLEPLIRNADDDPEVKDNPSMARRVEYIKREVDRARGAPSPPSSVQGPVQDTAETIQDAGSVTVQPDD